MTVGLLMSDGGAVENGLSAGGLLKDAREASGMHIAALAVALKVPVSKLEALEADNHSVLPDIVFVRALASSVCRTLKVDAGPVLALLPQNHSPRLGADSAGLDEPVKGRGGRFSSTYSSSPPTFSSASRSVAIVVLALLAGAAALVYFPRKSDGLATAVPSLESGQHPAIVESQGRAQRDLSPPMQGPTDQLSGPSAATPPQGPAAPLVAAPVSDLPAGAASGTAAPAGILLLRARGESWVQVKDSAGILVLQRNLGAGEVASVSGALPLSVVIGRADATEVFIRGNLFVLAAVSRENVARFEVK